MILRIVKMSFQPEKVEEFLGMFDEVKAGITRFDGCLGVKLYRDTKEPHILFTHSEWKDDASLEAYRSSAFFKQIWGKTKVLFSDKAEAWSLEMVA